MTTMVAHRVRTRDGYPTSWLEASYDDYGRLKLQVVHDDALHERVILMQIVTILQSLIETDAPTWSHPNNPQLSWWAHADWAAAQPELDRLWEIFQHG